MFCCRLYSIFYDEFVPKGSFPITADTALVNAANSTHRACDLIALFRHLFKQNCQTVLIGGAEEPLYQPGSENQEHSIYFTSDFFASALHEVAHWCVAGPSRRQQVDYGYWYVPDGRNQAQQHAFEQAEIKPQALEWIFCCAVNFRFRVSADNLNGDVSVSDEFKQSIWEQTQVYCRDGLPSRGAVFAQGLQKKFKGPSFLDAKRYRVEGLS